MHSDNADSTVVSNIDHQYAFLHFECTALHGAAWHSSSLQMISQVCMNSKRRPWQPGYDFVDQCHLTSDVNLSASPHLKLVPCRRVSMKSLCGSQACIAVFHLEKLTVKIHPINEPFGSYIYLHSGHSSAGCHGGRCLACGQDLARCKHGTQNAAPCCPNRCTHTVKSWLQGQRDKSKQTARAEQGWEAMACTRARCAFAAQSASPSSFQLSSTISLTLRLYSLLRRSMKKVSRTCSHDLQAPKFQHKTS